MYYYPAPGHRSAAQRREARRIVAAIEDPAGETALRPLAAGDAAPLVALTDELLDQGFAPAGDFAVSTRILRLLVRGRGIPTLAVVCQEANEKPVAELVSELSNGRLIVTAGRYEMWTPSVPDDISLWDGTESSPIRLLVKRHHEFLGMAKRSDPGAPVREVAIERPAATWTSLESRRVQHRRSHAGASSQELRARDLPFELILEMIAETRRRHRGEAHPSLRDAAMALVQAASNDPSTLSAVTAALDAIVVATGDGAAARVRTELAPLGLTLEELLELALPPAALEPVGAEGAAARATWPACEACDLFATAIPLLAKPGPLVGRFLLGSDEDARAWAADALLAIGSRAAGVAQPLFASFARFHAHDMGVLWGHRPPIVSQLEARLADVLGLVASHDPEDVAVSRAMLAHESHAIRWLAATTAPRELVGELEAMLPRQDAHWVRRAASQRLAWLLAGDARLLDVAWRALALSRETAAAKEPATEPEIDRAIAAELLAAAATLDPNRVLPELLVIARTSSDWEDWLRYEEGFHAGDNIACDALADAIERDREDPLLRSLLASSEDVARAAWHEVEHREQRRKAPS